MKTILLSSLILAASLSQSLYAETITIAGSTTVKKYMDVAVQVYAEKHPDIFFEVSGGGSGVGFGRFITSTVLIGMMSRNLEGNEADLLHHGRTITIAYDAVAPVASKELAQDAGIQSISINNLAKIYRGEITNWKDLNGPNKPILVIEKDLSRGTRHVFAKYILGSATAPQLPSAIILESNQDVANIISSSDQAIGYLSVSYANDDVYKLNIQEHGQTITPSVENIRNGMYPLARQLILLVPEHLPAYAQGFVDFILSEEGQALARQVGYIPKH